jgi:hypothetical protein
MGQPEQIAHELLQPEQIAHELLQPELSVDELRAAVALRELLSFSVTDDLSGAALALAEAAPELDDLARRLDDVLSDPRLPHLLLLARELVASLAARRPATKF